LKKLVIDCDFCTLLQINIINLLRNNNRLLCFLKLKTGWICRKNIVLAGYIINNLYVALAKNILLGGLCEERNAY